MCIFLAFFFDTDDEEEGKKSIQEFVDVGPIVNQVAVIPYEKMNELLNDFQYHGPRTYMKGIGFRTFSVELAQFAFEKYSELFHELGPDYALSAIVFEAHPTAKLASVSPDATAFVLRGDHYNAVFPIRWTNPDRDEWIRQWVRKFTADVRAIDKKTSLAQGKKWVGEIGYANMALPGDGTGEWFGGNLEKLRALKVKWDPKGIFNKGLAIPLTELDTRAIPSLTQ
jgi:FAD/FMN-containing dehydrogenase